MEYNSAMDEVNDLALQLLDKGRFKTQAEARNYVFQTRPHLERNVRVEANERRAAKPAEAPSPARAAVDKQARLLVDAGVAPTMAQARSSIYETQPKLAAAVRAESA